MKKSTLLLLLPLVMLTSCGGKPTFYGKTLVLKGTFDNLDQRLQDGSTNRKDLTTNFNSIDWSRIPEITEHSTVDKAIECMRNHAKALFETSYKNFSITINAKESGWATVKKGESSQGYRPEYATDDEDRMLLKNPNGETCYTIYANEIINGNFTKVSLDDDGSMVGRYYDFYYNEPIESIECVRVSVWANFLPQ